MLSVVFRNASTWHLLCSASVHSAFVTFTTAAGAEAALLLDGCALELGDEQGTPVIAVELHGRKKQKGRDPRDPRDPGDPGDSRDPSAETQPAGSRGKKRRAEEVDWQRDEVRVRPIMTGHLAHRDPSHRDPPHRDPPHRDPPTTSAASATADGRGHGAAHGRAAASALLVAPPRVHLVPCSEATVAVRFDFSGLHIAAAAQCSCYSFGSRERRDE